MKPKPSRETGRRTPPEASATTAPPDVPPDILSMPFEAALTELESIVEDLEDGALSLEDALTRFERGIHLSRHLEDQLKNAEVRVRRLVGGEGQESTLTAVERTTVEIETEVEPDEMEDEGENDSGSDRLF